MDFEALRETKAYIKFSWPSRFRNWGIKELELLLQFIGQAFFHAWNFLSHRPGELGEKAACDRGLSRLRGVGGLWARLPEKSVGWGGAAAGSAWTGALCLSSQSLARNGQEAGPHDGLVAFIRQYQQPPDAKGGFIVLSSSAFCQILYINIYIPHVKDRKSGAPCGLITSQPLCIPDDIMPVVFVILDLPSLCVPSLEK